MNSGNDYATAIYHQKEMYGSEVFNKISHFTDKYHLTIFGATFNGRVI